VGELDGLFNPRSIALVGASSDPHGISGRPLRLLIQHGYPGALYPVNPRHRELMGREVFPRIADVPGPVDLALVMVPAAVTPGVVEECAAAGVRYALVISSGFAEAGAEGRARQEELARAARSSGIRLAGPNSEGFFNVAAGVAAGFSPAIDPERGFAGARRGPVGVVSQSGGLGFALFNRGMELGLGFSLVVSSGNEADLTFLDYVDHLVDDPETRVILGVVETLRGARRLIDVARRAAERGKPLVLAKIGRSPVAARAAASHTGALVGSDAAYDAAFRQLGVVRVDDVDELLDAAVCFSAGRLPAGRRVAVVTPSGGAGAWLADACAAEGLELPEVEQEIQAEIRSFVPSYASTTNPVDLTAGVMARGGLERSIELLGRSPRFDTIAVVTTLASEADFRRNEPELRRVAADRGKAIVYYSYTLPKPGTIEALRAMRIPCFPTPRRTARAIAWAAGYAAFLRRRGEVAVFGAREARPRPGPLPEGEGASEARARAFLAPCGIPAPREGVATSPDEAAELFRRLGSRPVALKVQAAGLAHKSDVGGVRLGLDDKAAVRRAYDGVVGAVRRARPGRVVDGVLVQEMVDDGVEVILGARVDPDFGPVVLCGLGGLHVEQLGDVALRLAPVSAAEARAMVAELRGARLLDGVRGRPPCDVDALVGAIARFSALAAALPREVAAVEINPLAVRPRGLGVVMLDAAMEMCDEP
jgi:acyl-CoA synthetase (NDP forming)